MPTPDRTPKDPSPALGRRAMLAGLGLPAGLALSQAFSRSATAAPTQPLERAARGPLRTISAAELRAQQDADITEYYLTDPGQQGVFRHDAQDSSTADNTGTVLVTASGARYKRVFTGGLDVRWFGAVGDGSADDTDAVQNAVDVAQRSIVPVYLPAGDYAITRPISVASHRPGLRMFGDQMSSNSPTLTAHSSVSPDEPLPALILFDDTTIGRFFDFSNLMLNADGKAQYGIHSEKIVASRFHRCFIRGATEAALGIGYGYLNDIEDCEFTKNTGDGIRSVKGDVNVLNIVNCKILNNRGIGINLTSPGHGIRIEGCEIETNDQCGIYVAGGSMAVNITNCYFENNSVAGFAFTNPNRTIRAEIIITGTSISHAIAMEWPCGPVQVTGNYASMRPDAHADTFVAAYGVYPGLEIANNCFFGPSSGGPYPMTVVRTGTNKTGGGSICENLTMHGNGSAYHRRASLTVNDIVVEDTAGARTQLHNATIEGANPANYAAPLSAFTSGPAGPGTFVVADHGYRQRPAYEITGAASTGYWGFDLSLDEYPELAGQHVYFGCYARSPGGTARAVLHIDQLGDSDTGEPASSEWSPISYTAQLPASGTVRFAVRMDGADADAVLQVANPVLAAVGARFDRHLPAGLAV